MSEYDFTRLDAVYAESTQGRWRQANHVGEPRALVTVDRPHDSLLARDVDGMAIVDREPDARAIVELHNAYPDIRSAHKAQAAELARLRKIADAVECHVRTCRTCDGAGRVGPCRCPACGDLACSMGDKL